MHGVKLGMFNLDFKCGNIGEMCKKGNPESKLSYPVFILLSLVANSPHALVHLSPVFQSLWFEWRKLSISHDHQSFGPSVETSFCNSHVAAGLLRLAHFLGVTFHSDPSTKSVKSVGQ